MSTEKQQYTPTRVATQGAYFPELSREEQTRVLRALGREPKDDDPMQDDLLALATCGCILWGPADDQDGLLCLCPLHAAAPALLETAKLLLGAFETAFDEGRLSASMLDRAVAIKARATIAAAEGRDA